MTKSSHRKGIRLARELISIAREDFDTAKHLFGVGQFRWGLIALQQSLEKAILELLQYELFFSTKFLFHVETFMVVNVPVEFWDESVWRKYFREELHAFYSALAGFLEARREVLGRLSGDLAQVLRGGDRDLALQILLGGVWGETP